MALHRIEAEMFYDEAIHSEVFFLLAWEGNDKTLVTRKLQDLDRTTAL